MKLFGRVIVDIFIIVATFAIQKHSKTLHSLKHARTPTTYFYKINNISLFSEQSGDTAQINQIIYDFSIFKKG